MVFFSPRWTKLLIFLGICGVTGFSLKLDILQAAICNTLFAYCFSLKLPKQEYRIAATLHIWVTAHYEKYLLIAGIISCH